jgi:hypothetical protein
MMTKTGKGLAEIRHKRLIRFLHDYKAEMDLVEEEKGKGDTQIKL